MSACDVGETCTGASISCPADAVAPAATVCRPLAGLCDVQETCTGGSTVCPADGFQPNVTICRLGADVCDVGESCTGSSAACPTDAFLGAGTVCRASAGVCDSAENCTGSAAACPANSFVPATTTCRAGNACNTAKNCTGSTATCAPHTDVVFGGSCHYLNGSNGVCLAGYQLAPQSILQSIGPGFVGLGVKTTPFNNCCIKHAQQGNPPVGTPGNEGQDYGMGGADCSNFSGPWTTGPILGGASCTDAFQNNSQQLTICSRPPKRIFASADINGGAFGGIAGADSRCSTDPAKPVGGVWKALIVDGTARRATITGNVGDGQIDWVLLPDMKYVRASDGLEIMVTNSARLFPFGNLSNPIAFGRLPWTGLFGNWQGGPSCGNWTSGTGNGISGDGSQTGSASIAFTLTTCTGQLRSLICVEQ